MNISSIESEYNEINASNGWYNAYQTIKEKSEQETKEKKFSLDECNKQQNRKLNRYRDVNPYDHSRIILHRGSTDYINANLVKMERAKRKYILTQGPLENTVSHFWGMVWEQNSKAILMLNKIIEKKQVKCHMYWPELKGPENQLNLNDVGLSVQMLRSEEYTHYTKRVFRLTDVESTKSREVIQFQYNTWPDFGIPSSPIAFLQFLKQVRDSGALNDDVGPAVVHCSAGIGRSGTFCLVDCCLVLVDIEGENKVSVSELLLELRRFRMGLIQTPDQLFFSYKAIIEGINHFNDPNCCDYDEVIPYEKEFEDIAPPLPPPRGESLGNNTLYNSNRPLPMIPSSVSAHELNNENRHTVANNNHENTITERPLLPLGKVSESEDTEEEYDELNGNDSDTANISSESDMSETKMNKETMSNFDPDTTLPPSPTEKSAENGLDNSNGNNASSENNELRRRIRRERQSAMESKIKEIKRKQRAAEEEAARAPKKRRSMMITIAAGVGLLCFCVYAYTKFG